MIRLFRLTTGEDLIGTPDQDTTTDDFQGIKQPFVLIPMQGEPGKPMKIGFSSLHTIHKRQDNKNKESKYYNRDNTRR